MIANTIQTPWIKIYIKDRFIYICYNIVVYITLYQCGVEKSSNKKYLVKQGMIIFRKTTSTFYSFPMHVLTFFYLQLFLGQCSSFFLEIHRLIFLI